MFRINLPYASYPRTCISKYGIGIFMYPLGHGRLILYMNAIVSLFNSCSSIVLNNTKFYDGSQLSRYGNHRKPQVRVSNGTIRPRPVRDEYMYRRPLNFLAFYTLPC